MSSVNTAAAAAAASQAQVQLALSAKFAKSNATTEQSVVQLIEASNANLQQLVNSSAASGVGATLDISA